MSDIVRISLEALAGDLVDWTYFKRDDLNRHVVWFVGDYALRRGVILDPDDILQTLDLMLVEMNITAPLPDGHAARPDFDL